MPLLPNDITLNTNHDSYGRFLQINNGLYYDGFGQTISLSGSDAGCCDTILDKLDSIESQLQPVIVEVPIEVIVYKEKLVPVHTTEYVLTTTTVYVELPCDNKPLPLPKKTTIISHSPIQPPNVHDRVIPIPPVWSFPPNPNPIRRLSPRTINGKLVHVELK